MTYDFSDELSRLISAPVSGMGRLSAESVSKELYKGGINISASHIRNLTKGYSPSNLSAAELLALSDLLTGEPMYLGYRLGLWKPETQEMFKKLDSIYRRIYGN